MQLQQLLPIALIIGVFYFLIIRPQQKRAKDQRSMLAALKPGDEIVTIGGIFATVIEVGERIRVKVADGSELELAKPAIAQVVDPRAESEDDSGDAGSHELPADEGDADSTEGETPDAPAGGPVDAGGSRFGSLD